MRLEQTQLGSLLTNALSQSSHKVSARDEPTVSHMLGKAQSLNSNPSPHDFTLLLSFHPSIQPTYWFINGAMDGSQATMQGNYSPN